MGGKIIACANSLFQARVKGREIVVLPLQSGR